MTNGFRVQIHFPSFHCSFFFRFIVSHTAHIANTIFTYGYAKNESQTMYNNQLRIMLSMRNITEKSKSYNGLAGGMCPDPTPQILDASNYIGIFDVIHCQSILHLFLSRIFICLVIDEVMKNEGEHFQDASENIIFKFRIRFICWCECRCCFRCYWCAVHTLYYILYTWITKMKIHKHKWKFIGSSASHTDILSDGINFNLR